MNRLRAGNLSQLACAIAGFLWIGLFVPNVGHGAGSSNLPKTDANVPIELTFHAGEDLPDPFNQVTFDVTFTNPSGQSLRVPGFWDGGRTWKVRYASPIPGIHQYQTECSRTSCGLGGISGKIEIHRYRGQNPLFHHGPVRIADDHRHFEYADGTPFFWLGDTWWMGLCHRIQWPGEFKELTADRVQKGFNVVQIVAGLYPDMPPFDPRGANENGYPWETNYSRIRPEYFDAADQRLRFLIDSGIEPCIVGAWGYFFPWMGLEKTRQHWRYLVARYGAWPVIWCAAGEANLPYYLVKNFPYEARDQIEGWSQVLATIREIDPYRRPLTLHPTGIGKLSARGCVTDERLLDFDMLQTGHGMLGSLQPTIKTVTESYNSKPAMPVINGEVCYEMLGDNIPADIVRIMFYASVLNGAAGHTYGANGIWQCNRPGQPHGASPHGGSYGKIPWNEAMNLPGSRQLGFARNFIEHFDWVHFEPASETVSWAEESTLPRWGDWIWYPEGDPTRDAPAEERFFRRIFELPEGKSVRRARMVISADDQFQLLVNGQAIGSGADWHSPSDFEVTPLLRPGRNVLAIRAQNGKHGINPNPAGLNANLQIEFADQSAMTIHCDKSWRVAKVGPEGWASLDFNDSAWPSAATIAKFGDGPWGTLQAGDSLLVPFAAGINGTLRMVYAPKSRTLKISKLQPSRLYAVTCFDPVTGDRTKLTPARADKDGRVSINPPLAHDYLVTLEHASPPRQ